MSDNHAESGVRLSVVVAGYHAGDAINRCVRSLQAQTTPEVIEILVVDSDIEGEYEESAGNIRVRRLAPGDNKTIPFLRGRAIARANGAIIALLDPYCEIKPTWAANLLRAFERRSEAVLGGPVLLADANNADKTRWATYFSEYAAFLPPIINGPTTGELPGNNVAYRRCALGDRKKMAEQGFWKTFHNQRLRAENHLLGMDDAIPVALNKPIRFADFLVSRYHHGRCFGAMRTGGRAGERLWRLLLIPLVPVVTMLRLTQTLWLHREMRPRFLRAIPALLAFQIAWAVGEGTGYARGAGNSAEKLHY